MEGKWAKSLKEIKLKMDSNSKQEYRAPKVRMIVNDKKMKTEEEQKEKVVDSSRY
jgi:hypothetical protein